MNPGIITEAIASFAGFLGSLGIIAGTFYKWAWKPYIARKEKREEKLQETMKEIAAGKVGPVVLKLEDLAEQNKRHDETDKKLEKIATQNIEIINKMHDDFKEHNHQAKQRDRLIAQNADIIKKHDERLDRHSERILILEHVSGLNPRLTKEKNKE